MPTGARRGRRRADHLSLGAGDPRRVARPGADPMTSMFERALGRSTVRPAASDDAAPIRHRPGSRRGLRRPWRHDGDTARAVVDRTVPADRSAPQHPVPDVGTDVPFTIENYPYRDPFDRETVTFVREYTVGRRRRRFDATMILVGDRIVDYLGTHQHLAVDLDLTVDENGGLILTSDAQRFYEGVVGFRFPMRFSGQRRCANATTTPTSASTSTSRCTTTASASFSATAVASPANGSRRRMPRDG